MLSEPSGTDAGIEQLLGHLDTQPRSCGDLGGQLDRFGERLVDNMLNEAEKKIQSNPEVEKISI